MKSWLRSNKFKVFSILFVCRLVSRCHSVSMYITGFVSLPPTSLLSLSLSQSLYFSACLAICATCFFLCLLFSFSLTHGFCVCVCVCVWVCVPLSVSLVSPSVYLSSNFIVMHKVISWLFCAAPGGPWDDSRVHDLCQPLGGQENSGCFS